MSNAISIAAGGFHTCAVTSTGDPLCWGSGGSGQLGNGSLNDASTPASVPNLSNVSAMTAGADFTCALLADSTVECWGNNFNGQVGQGNT
ncbi:RCC1 domain-containing protein, partial [Salmonella enterica]|uniref:RCC1 domain-containing protein n=1 Tax=Salmonella enterica TaxID=28901 RepID=UPI003FA70777